jgi:hypothetical protein
MGDPTEGRGRHHWGATFGPSRGKLRGRASSPKALLFAPGSTTPAEQANPVPAGRQCHTGLESFIRGAQVQPMLGWEVKEGEQGVTIICHLGDRLGHLAP